MNIMVTGAAGFIGSNFCHYLAEKMDSSVVGKKASIIERVIMVDELTYAGDLKNLDNLLEHEKFIFAKADISNRLDLTEIFIGSNKPDIVINFAAESHVDNSIDDASNFVVSNIQGVNVLLSLCRIAGVKRFVQISTDEVYGHIGFKDEGFKPWTELNPRNPYAATKAAADLLIKAHLSTYGGNSPACKIIRCTNNYGPRQNFEKMIPKTIYCLAHEQPVRVYGDGQNRREWIYVKEFCKAIFTEMWKDSEFNKKGYPVIHVGGGHEMTNLELVLYIAEIMGTMPDMEYVKPLIEFVSDRPGHDLRYAFLEEYTCNRNYHSTHIYDAMTETIRWYISKLEVNK